MQSEMCFSSAEYELCDCVIPWWKSVIFSNNISALFTAFAALKFKKKSAFETFPRRVDAKWLDSFSAWWNSSFVLFFLQILLMKGLQNEDRGIKEECLEQTVLVSSQGVRLFFSFSFFFFFVLPPSFLSLCLSLPFHAFIIYEQWLIDCLKLTHRHC